MQADATIIVPEEVKRTKKQRTPAQLDALKKGRDSHVEKSRLRRENEIAQSRPSAPSTAIDIPFIQPRRQESEDSAELKALKRELKDYKTKNIVRDLVEVELKRVKEIKQLAKKKPVEGSKPPDREVVKPQPPPVVFMTRKYGMPINYD